MGVPVNALPDDSLAITYAFNVAIAIVNQQLLVANPLIYELAVYNLAGDNLINWAPDVPQVPVATFKPFVRDMAATPSSPARSLAPVTRELVSP